MVRAAAIVETSAVWARVCARIEPAWVEHAAGELVQRRHYDPYWDARRGHVMGFEELSLFGLTLVARRRIAYERIDPQLCRELFIRDGLVGEFESEKLLQLMAADSIAEDQLIAWDFNEDQVIDEGDWLEVILNWGHCAGNAASLTVTE